MSAMQVISQNTVNPAWLQQASPEAAKERPVDVSHKLADIAADKKKTATSSAGQGAGIALRQPDAVLTMPVADTLAAVEKRVLGQTLPQSLASFADSAADNGAKAGGFDISRLKTSQVAALFVVIQNALQENKTAQRQNQSDMAIVKGQMADGAANAMRASGQAALNGSISQAAFGLSISGAGFGLQQKGINRERAMLREDSTSLLKQQNDLNRAQLNSAKGGASSLDVAPTGRTVRLDTTDGNGIDMPQNRLGVQSRHQAHIDEAAQARLKNEVGVSEIDIRDKQAKADSTKAKGMLVSQMAHPTTGIIGGNTQVMQADENAQQHLHQQAGQVADGLAEASNVNARDFENLIQTVAQKLADIQRAHLDTAGMIAGKSV